MTELQTLDDLIRERCGTAAPAWVYVVPANFPFEVADQQDYPITLDVSSPIFIKN